MLQHFKNHMVVKRIEREFSDRPTLDSPKENVICSLCLFSIVLFSNLPMNILWVFVMVVLLLSKKTKELSWPHLLVIAAQISFYLLFVMLRKSQMLFWQGFFLKFGIVYGYSKKVCLWSEPLFILLPVCLGLLFLKKNKKYSIFFFFCAFLHQFYFLPFVGILLLFKVKIPIVCFVVLWLVENYIFSFCYHLFPPYVQWIDLILLVFLFPIALIIFDIPQKIYRLRWRP